LSDQQTIEGIAVMVGQVIYMQCVAELDRQGGELMLAQAAGNY
jgi:hypothetical protein